MINSGEKAPLTIPISLFVGKNDHWVRYEDHFGWSEQTLNQCNIHEFHGEHLFIKDVNVSNEVLATVAHIMTIYSTSPEHQKY